MEITIKFDSLKDVEDFLAKKASWIETLGGIPVGTEETSTKSKRGRPTKVKTELAQSEKIKAEEAKAAKAAKTDELDEARKLTVAHVANHKDAILSELKGLGFKNVTDLYQTGSKEGQKLYMSFLEGLSLG